MLDKVDGPDCPGCGCRDTQLLQKVTDWGDPAERRRCNHCGKKFTARIESAELERDNAKHCVEYPLLTCPYCDSIKTRVQSTRRPLRQHTCLDCEEAFQSIERPV